jgi:hypothetical protein
MAEDSRFCPACYNASGPQAHPSSLARNLLKLFLFSLLAVMLCVGGIAWKAWSDVQHREAQSSQAQSSPTIAKPAVGAKPVEPVSVPAKPDANDAKMDLVAKLSTLSPENVMERCGTPSGDVPKRILSSTDGRYYNERILIYANQQNGSVGVIWATLIPDIPDSLLHIAGLQVIRNNVVVETYEWSLTNFDWVYGFVNSLPCLAPEHTASMPTPGEPEAGNSTSEAQKPSKWKRLEKSNKIIYVAPSENAPNTYLGVGCVGSTVNIIFTTDKDIDTDHPVTTYTNFKTEQTTWMPSSDGDHHYMMAPYAGLLLADMVKDGSSIAITYLLWNEHVGSSRASFSLEGLPVTGCPTR